MTGHGEKLSRKQDQAITALLTCASITEAATQCGLAEVTVRRWLKQDTFQQAYRDARRQVVQQAIVQVQQATGEAVATLRTVMQAPEAPECPSQCGQDDLRAGATWRRVGGPGRGAGPLAGTGPGRLRVTPALRRYQPLRIG
jgi:hypothetical protein